jgi:hypothetical protein
MKTHGLLKGKETANQVIKAFAKMDTNKDKRISIEEFKTGMKNWGLDWKADVPSGECTLDLWVVRLNTAINVVGQAKLMEVVNMLPMKSRPNFTNAQGDERIVKPLSFSVKTIKKLATAFDRISKNCDAILKSEYSSKWHHLEEFDIYGRGYITRDDFLQGVKNQVLDEDYDFKVLKQVKGSKQPIGVCLDWMVAAGDRKAQDVVMGLPEIVLRPDKRSRESSSDDEAPGYPAKRQRRPAEPKEAGCTVM